MKTDEGGTFGGGATGRLGYAVAVLAISVITTGCASSGRGELDTGSRGAFTQVEGDSRLYSFDLTSDRTAVRHTLAADPAAAWAALPAVYEEVGLQGARVVDAKRRVFGIVSRVVAPQSLAGEPLSRFLTCGSRTAASSADTYEVRLRALTQIDSTAGGSAVLTRLDAVARSRGVSGLPVRCSTTGRLERLLVDSLQARAVRAGGP